MNRVILIGRLTRDPELRYTQSGKAVASFSLAVDRMNRKQAEANGYPTADFIPCIAWDKTAETIGNHLSKGRRIGVEGRLQSRSYEDKTGAKRTAYDVVLNTFEFLDSRNDNAQQGSYDQQGDYGAQGGYSRGSNMSDPLPDEDIPF